MNINKKAVGFKKIIKKNDLIFRYNKIADPLLCIVYIVALQVLCSCSACLSRLVSPWNIIQGKYNKDRYKVGKKTAFIGLFYSITTIEKLFIVLKV